MDDRGYYIIDGSHLFQSIYEIWRTKPGFDKKKLSIPMLTEALERQWSLHLGTTIRIVYYFKKQDSRLKNMVEYPEADDPGKKDHWQIKECGESIQAIPDDELQKISPQFRDHFARSEKGLDAKLICDVLLLVASGRASNIVFLVNDRDYIPLFEAIEDLGGNVYLAGLDSSQKPAKRLAMLADKYLTLDSELDSIFGITTPPVQEAALAQEIKEPTTALESTGPELPQIEL